jgi:1-acyl-sn-glycerol-3-phosphate acyltransferase
LLAKPKLTGRKNIPKRGPLIIAGNHSAMIEIFLIMAYAPGQIEFIGSGDIPLDPDFQKLTDFYGFIPYKRGQMDSAALKQSVDVLKQGGIIGIFPEGGIWDSTRRKSHRGVAWLSHMTGAPVLPVGFGGQDEFFKNLRKFKFPEVKMNVGTLIKPRKTDRKHRHEEIQKMAEEVMDTIHELIPPEAQEELPVEERFELEIAPDFPISHPERLSLFFHRPVLLDAFARNLQLPVTALQNLKDPVSAESIVKALDAILNYLEKENPYFLPYRFGDEVAEEMKGSLTSLYEACKLNPQSQVLIRPIRYYRFKEQKEAIREDLPRNAQNM